MGNPISIKVYKKGIRIYFESLQDKSGYILSHRPGSSRYHTRVTIDKLSIEPGDYDLTYLQTQDIYFIEER